MIRHHFGSGKAVFEFRKRGHHDYPAYLQCGRVEEFFGPEIETRQDQIAKEPGFTIREHSMYLYVDCAKASCPYRT